MSAAQKWEETISELQRAECLTKGWRCQGGRFVVKLMEDELSSNFFFVMLSGNEEMVFVEAPSLCVYS